MWCGTAGVSVDVCALLLAAVQPQWHACPAQRRQLQHASPLPAACMATRLPHPEAHQLLRRLLLRAARARCPAAGAACLQTRWRSTWQCGRYARRWPPSTTATCWCTARTASTARVREARACCAARRAWCRALPTGCGGGPCAAASDGRHLLHASALAGLAPPWPPCVLLRSHASVSCTLPPPSPSHACCILACAAPHTGLHHRVCCVCCHAAMRMHPHKHTPLHIHHLASCVRPPLPCRPLPQASSSCRPPCGCWPSAASAWSACCAALQASARQASTSMSTSAICSSEARSMARMHAWRCTTARTLLRRLRDGECSATPRVQRRS